MLSSKHLCSKIAGSIFQIKMVLKLLEWIHIINIYRGLIWHSQNILLSALIQLVVNFHDLLCSKLHPLWKSFSVGKVHNFVKPCHEHYFRIFLDFHWWHVMSCIHFSYLLGLLSQGYSILLECSHFPIEQFAHIIMIFKYDYIELGNKASSSIAISSWWPSGLYVVQNGSPS